MRREVIKDVMAPDSLKSQEVTLLDLALQTEYFASKDLFQVA